jgi:hypothetical protein
VKNIYKVNGVLFEVFIERASSIKSLRCRSDFLQFAVLDLKKFIDDRFFMFVLL